MTIKFVTTPSQIYYISFPNGHDLVSKQALFLYVPRVALGQASGGGVGSASGFEPNHFKTSNASYNMSYDKILHTYTFTAEMMNQDGSSYASITTIFVDGKITVAPGQTATITLVSPKPFFVFTLFEGNYHYSTSFIK